MTIHTSSGHPCNLQLPIPKDPINPMVAVYNALEEFVVQMAEEDPQFVVFLYNLSNYKSMDDLPPPIETTDDLLDDIEEWLLYFPQAKPWISGSDMYMALLSGLSVSFPKVIKNLSDWMHSKCFGIWKAYLQLLPKSDQKPQHLDAQQMLGHLESLPSIGTAYFAWLATVLHSVDGCGTAKRGYLGHHRKHSCWPLVEND